ncbi:MAG: hypothetical protein KC621_09985 [Myxococcales bacterium]|nr:hypothetical protein [Myxococcales bacterium]
MELTFHHLVPKSQHKRSWCRQRFDRDQRNRGIDVCRDCHSAFHRFVSEAELARSYHTVELLLAHPEIGTFVTWVSTRSGRHRTAPPRRR